jgi:cystathionine beta-lyase
MIVEIRPTEKQLTAHINWFQKNHNWTIDSSSIMFAPGAVSAVSNCVKAFTKPGDTVNYSTFILRLNRQIIVQTPVYYPFFGAIEKNSRILIKNQLLYVWDKDRGTYHYSIDYDDFETKIKVNNVKLFILCSPHNPVGRIWTVDELLRMSEICKKYKVIIVADEIHCDLTLPWSKIPFTPLCTVMDDIHNFTVAVNSASKTFNLAGLCCCSVIISNPELRNIYLEEQFSRCGNFGVDAFGIVAMEAAYSQCEYWLVQLREYLQENLNYLDDTFKKYLPMVRISKPEATYLVWCDFKFLGLDSEKLKELLLSKSHVLIDDGKKFGDSDFIRINIACPRKMLEESLSRIVQFCQQRVATK